MGRSKVKNKNRSRVSLYHTVEVDKLRVEELSNISKKEEEFRSPLPPNSSTGSGATHFALFFFHPVPKKKKNPQSRPLGLGHFGNDDRHSALGRLGRSQTKRAIRSRGLKAAEKKFTKSRLRYVLTGLCVEHNGYYDVYDLRCYRRFTGVRRNEL